MGRAWHCVGYAILRRFISLMLLFSNHLLSIVGAGNQQALKRNIFTSDVAVQTESIVIGITAHSMVADEPIRPELYEDEESQLTSADLTAILKWSKDISSDINLSSGTFFLELRLHDIHDITLKALRRLTEIAFGTVLSFAIYQLADCSLG